MIEDHAHTNSDEYNKEDMCGFMVLTTDAHF